MKAAPKTKAATKAVTKSWVETKTKAATTVVSKM